MVLLVNIIIVCVVIGILLVVLNEVPIDPATKRIIRIVALGFLAIWLLLVITGAAPLIHVRG